MNSVNTTTEYSNNKSNKGRIVFIIICLLNLAIILGLALPVYIKGTAWAIHIIRDVHFKWPSPIYLITNIYTFGIVIGLVWHSVVTKGWRASIIALSALFVIGFLFEGWGVNYGWIYGPYHYTELVYWHIWGVPIIVPFGWELFLYSSMYMARLLLPLELRKKQKTFLQKLIPMVLIACVASIITTTYDLVADPIFVTLKNWIWHAPGHYTSYVDGGVPIMNYVGWLITGFVASMAYQIIMFWVPEDEATHSRYLDAYLPVAFFGTMFSFGMTVAVLYLQREDLALVTLCSLGLVTLMGITKCYLITHGYEENRTIAAMSKESIGNV